MERTAVNGLWKRKKTWTKLQENLNKFKLVASKTIALKVPTKCLTDYSENVLQFYSLTLVYFQLEEIIIRQLNK